MKPKLLCLAVLCILLVFSVSSSHAALLGIKGQLGYPDIMFSNGTIGYVYDPVLGEGLLSLEATDLLLTISDDEEYYLSGPGYTTKLYLTLVVTLDNSGRPILFSGDMTEKVEEGILFIGNKAYPQGTPLLTGRVYAFGWGEGQDLGKFDFLIRDLGGELIKDGLWPNNFPVGMYLEALRLKGWDGSWTGQFELAEATGDKAVVPIPASVILLSSGLGLVSIFGRRNCLKRSERRLS